MPESKGTSGGGGRVHLCICKKETRRIDGEVEN